MMTQTGNELPPGPQLPALLQMFGIWWRPTAFLERCRVRYGHRFTMRIRVPARPYVVISAPEEIRQVFQAPADVLHCGEGSATIEKYTGQTGLAWMDEDEHLVRRKLINRSMHGGAVERIAATIREIAAAEVGSWPRERPVSVHALAHTLTLKVMRQVTFGERRDPRLDELIGVLTELMEFNNGPGSVLQIHLFPDRVVRALSAVRPLGLREFLEMRARAHELIDAVVAERRREPGEGEDLVAMLLSSSHEDGSPLSAIELRDEIMTTFLAGTETTASAISWATDRLAREPVVRGELVEEIDGGGEEALLAATVCEVLRLRPPLPQIIPRHVVQPIEIGGIEYQPGVELWISPYLVHHDPAVYPDPYSFRPARFLDEAPGTYTWIPFGGGRRRCLGKNIAELEIKCVLREILANCDVALKGAAGERARSRAITIVPAQGARVVLSDRERSRRGELQSVGG